MYGMRTGGMGQFVPFGVGRWGMGDVTTQDVSTASYVLGQNIWANVGDLAQLIQDPFYGLGISATDAISAAQQGMAAMIAAQNPGVDPNAVVSAVIAQGNNASIASVTPTLPAATLQTSGYMAANPLTAQQVAANQAMQQAVTTYQGSAAAQAAGAAITQAAQSQYNVPVPTGYMVMSTSPTDTSTGQTSSVLGSTPQSTAIIGGQSVITPQQLAALTPAGAQATTPISGNNLVNGTVAPAIAATVPTVAPSGNVVNTPVAAGGGSNWCFPGDTSPVLSSSIPVCTYTAIGAAVLLLFFLVKK